MALGHDHISEHHSGAEHTENVFCKALLESLEGSSEESELLVYKKGEYIFKEGTRPRGIYCVNRGKIKLTKRGEDGKDQIVRLVKPGDPLGYRSLLSGDIYASSAVSLEESEICFIPKELFLSILQSDSKLGMQMMKLLGEDLKKAEVQITHLAQKPVRERVAEALLFIKETYGFEADGKTIDVVFSREDIANIVGTATETAIRLLSEFNKDNIIHLKGKKIEIINLPKLVKVANIAD